MATGNSDINDHTIIIKIPRGKVEIIETLKIEDNDEDVDIESHDEYNSSQLSDNITITEEKMEANLEIYENDILVKEETIKTNPYCEDIYEEERIDKAVQRNLNIPDVQSECETNSEFEVDEDASVDWKLNTGKKKRKSFVRIQSECTSYENNEYSKEEEEESDSEWNISSGKRTLKKKRISLIQKTNFQPVKSEYQCSYCEKCFPLENRRIKHEKRWHLNSLHCCQLCSYKTNTSYLLRKHVFFKHGQIMLECPLCNISFPSLEVLRVHSERIHNTGAYICDKCHKVYTLEACVKSHQTHCGSKTKVNVLKCEDCNKVFATKFTLEAHLERHMGIKYKCNECPEVFEWQRELYRHKEVKHSGISYRCDECERDFADDRGLAKHLKLVHDVKGGMPAKYECTMCPNKYWQKITLARHIKNDHCQPGDSLIDIHDKISKFSKRNKRHKEFSCDICGKRYERKDNIRDHLRSVHYGLHYKCNLCPNTFTFADSFRKHMRDHDRGCKKSKIGTSTRQDRSC